MPNLLLSDARDRLQAALEIYWEECEAAGRQPGPEVLELVTNFVRRKTDWYGED